MSDQNNMHHYYLNKLVDNWLQEVLFTEVQMQDEHISKKRKKLFKKELKKYGFADCETWHLDSLLFMWLYERVCMYEDVATMIDMDYHKFLIPIVSIPSSSPEKIHKKLRERNKTYCDKKDGSYYDKFLVLDWKVEQYTQKECINYLKEYLEYAIERKRWFDDFFVDDAINDDFGTAALDIWSNIMYAMWW